MSRSTLRDKNQKVIGFIDVKSDGNQVLLNKNLSPIGFYDAKSDTTRGKNNGKLIGKGNLLAMLV